MKNRALLFTFCITILIAVISVPSPGLGREYEKHMSLVTRGGASIPAGDYSDRVNIQLPYLSLAFRVQPVKYSQYVLLEAEAGFYSYRAKRDIAGNRAIQYAEPLMVNVLASVHIWKGLFFYPKFGAGFILNQVRGSSSTGAFNHVGCSVGVEFLYRISERVGITVRTSAVFGFDKNRVLYQVVPDLGVAVYF